MNVSIITARGGSQSIINKNVYEVAGIPLIGHVIKASSDAKLINRIYISTDCPIITQYGQKNGCIIINRPEELRGGHVNHGDVIRHAVEYVDKYENGLKNVVVLLGNTVMVDGQLIDEAFQILENNNDIDSVMTLWEAADDHPLRALEIQDGFIVPYGGLDRQVSTERQSYPKAYYYDQGIWAFHKECVQKREGPNPWWWMGKRCYPIVRNWITGRDIHTILDVSIAEWWLAHYPEVKNL